jgi:hypothetical protein
MLSRSSIGLALRESQLTGMPVSPVLPFPAFTEAA